MGQKSDSAPGANDASNSSLRREYDFLSFHFFPPVRFTLFKVFQSKYNASTINYYLLVFFYTSTYIYILAALTKPSRAKIRSKRFPIKNMLGLCYTLSLYIYNLVVDFIVFYILRFGLTAGVSALHIFFHSTLQCLAQQPVA